ncbi:ATP-binding protein [Bacillota bacterium LX-D]|nr:ATP-binding protein [Bacillota bacterium LX-D]
MLAITIPIIALAFLITAYFIYQEVKKELILSTQKEAANLSRNFATEVKASLNKSMSISNNLAKLIESDLQGSHSLNRSDVIHILQKYLAANPNIVAVYVGFESNAFDGLDAQYRNKPGHDASGRFVPYINRINKKMGLEPLVGYLKPGSGDYYNLPKKTGQMQIIEPYFYQGILRASFVVPIKDAQGNFLGIAGCDMSLDSLDTLVSKIKINQSGNAYLVSNKGIYVSHPNKALLGYAGLENLDVGKIKDVFAGKKTFVKPVTAADIEKLEIVKKETTSETNEAYHKLTKEVKSGKAGLLKFFESYSNKTIWTFYNPVVVEGASTPWSLLVNVPIDEALAPLYNLISKIILIIIFALFNVLILVHFFVNIVMQPVDETVDVLLDVGKGNLSRRVTFKSTDEIGAMGTALNKMLDSMQTMMAEREKMDAELFKINKLESLELMARGVAHDFNNILMIILGNISLAKMYGNNLEKMGKKLKEIEKAALQAKDLVQHLLTITKGVSPNKKVLCLDKLLKETTKFSLSGSNIKCQYSIAPDLWLTEADEGQINQVFNNLIINAIQAMPEGGTIRVKAENRTTEEKSILPIEPGKYIYVTVEDEGCGIPEENLTKIFDPFFTTKQSGNGIGLATTYSIIKKHGGYITAESQVGKGTKFLIYLPATNKKHVEQREQSKLIMGRGKILLMDDDARIREIGEKMLTRLGYQVALASDGGEAVELYEKAKEEGKPFRAAIIDLTVPGKMGGKKALEKILAIDPAARVILASGYSFGDTKEQFKDHEGVNFVAKPYQLEELGKILANLLNK